MYELYLEKKDNSSFKFYHIKQNNKTVNISYGRIGAKVTQLSKELVSEEEAIEFARNKAQEKIEKGYNVKEEKKDIDYVQQLKFELNQEHKLWIEGQEKLKFEHPLIPNLTTNLTVVIDCDSPNKFNRIEEVKDEVNKAINEFMNLEVSKWEKILVLAHDYYSDYWGIGDPDYEREVGLQPSKNEDPRTLWKITFK